MSRSSRHVFVGIAALVVGIAMLFFNLRLFTASFGKLWPALLLFAGMILFVYYFSTKRKKERPFALFLAVFLVLAAVPFFVMTFTPAGAVRYLWPAFLLAFGLALLSLYYYGKQEKRILGAAVLTISVSIIAWLFYITRTQLGLVFGVVLFVTGLLFLARGLITGAEPAGVQQPGESRPAEGRGEN